VLLVVRMLYGKKWLDARADGDPAGRTNRAVQHEVRPLPHKHTVT